MRWSVFWRVHNAEGPLPSAEFGPSVRVGSLFLLGQARPEEKCGSTTTTGSGESGKAEGAERARAGNHADGGDDGAASAERADEVGLAAGEIDAPEAR